MGLKDTWEMRENGVDDILAEDINSVANAIIQNEIDIENLYVEAAEADEKFSEINKVAANAIKGVANGEAAVLITDVSPLPHDMRIITSPNSKITSYGKNLINYKAEGVTARGTVEVIENGLRWKQGGTYYIRIPCSLPKGFVVKGSFTDNGEGTDKINNIRIEYANGTIAPIYSDGFLNLADDVVAAYIYKSDPSIALTKDVEIRFIQLEVGETATEYEEYVEPMIYTANSEGVIEGLKSIYPSITLVSENESNIAVTYNQDVNAVINRLINAIVSLGGNV